MTIREFLKSIKPDIVWMTVYDMMIMYEQIDEDVDERNFVVQVSYAYKRGWFKRRIDENSPHHSIGKKPMLYLRTLGT